VNVESPKKESGVFRRFQTNAHVCGDFYKQLCRKSGVHILEHCDRLLAFGWVKGFRKWRFKQFIYSEKMLHTLCKRITNGTKTFFGPGDWSQQDGEITKETPYSTREKVPKGYEGACLCPNAG
jgi:hypothetical protein